jgi:eukaryotic-like serine/threonine-protein kinase
VSIEPGQTLAHYRIVRRIGAGGMGEVYRAADTVLGRDVAIKMLPPDVATDPDRVARFRREAHLLAALNHPHIAAIYGFEQTKDCSFLVLELVEGENLAERISREPLDTREALEIARQVADALEAAHEAGIVHRAVDQCSRSRRGVTPLMRVAIELPRGLRLNPEPPQISPDGRYVAVTGRQTGEKDRVWIRPLDGAAFRPLGSTDGASGVFWSADSSVLAFFAAGTLKRVGVSGGSPQSLYVLEQSDFTVGGSWNRDGVMLFSKGAPSVRHEIFSLSSAGGTPTAVTTPGASRSERHFHPQWLPDGRRFLFVAMLDRETNGLYVSSIDDPSRRQRIHPDTGPAVVRNGHLVFVRSGTLFAQPVDARLQLAGEPAPLAERAGPFSSSDSGTIAYLPARGLDMQLTWVARDGRTLTTFGDPRPYRQIALSPQGQVAAELTTEDLASSTWTLDARGVASKLASSSNDPVWSRDGRGYLLVWLRHRSATNRLWPGGASCRRQGRAQYPKCWSTADDALLYLMETDKGTEIWRAPAGGHGAPEPLIRNGFANHQPQVSPDGRWLAYVSNESGTMDVYVAPYRRPEARVRVSPAGGGQPTWRGDSKELFYISARNHLMSVAIGAAAGSRALATEAVPQLSSPTSLFEVVPEFIISTYAPAPDGQRFLVMRPVASEAGHLEMIVNWAAR